MPTSDTETIIRWKSKGLSDENIRPSITPGNSLVPNLKWIYTAKVAVEFRRGSCLKQGKATFTHGNVVNLLISMNKVHGQ